MHRVEVYLKSHLPDARGLGLVKDIQDLGITTVSGVRVADIYWLDADLPPDKLDLICRQLLADPITQQYQHFTPAAEAATDLSQQSQNTPPHQGEKPSHLIEVAYNAGVADPVEETILKAIGDLGVAGVGAVRTGKRYIIEGQLDDDELQTICSRLLVNPIIQHVVTQFRFPENPQYSFRLNEIEILDSAQE